ncbi:hypothetical protein [Sphingobium yanoikuyae]|uniref:Uncharacterized protein n=1 Tax=Sphingobium yanoikuyae TaxID=13690 RepID=A0A0J9D3G8_SPHYA|nr:hypothetical protein [Sphingobium yanoikuyae]ATP20792.1 hypothetical protein BV87_22025 [Sphingobium yanoikuyae]KMW31141.1 hypothetical protein BV87_02880 [Sphingobium yanoikuyae]
MADAAQARSDDASRSEPFCPPERKLGTHRIDHSDPAFNGLPDLTSGRTHDDAIARLEWIGAHRIEHYGRAWLDEARDIGLTVQRVRSDNGPSLEIGYPCDWQLDMRKKRADALVAHFKALAEGRDLILAELQRAGSVYGHMMAVRS